MADPVVGASYTDEDWYGVDLADRSYQTCTFAHVDLTEATSRGAVFALLTRDPARQKVAVRPATPCPSVPTNRPRKRPVLGHYGRFGPASNSSPTSRRYSRRSG